MTLGSGVRRDLVLAGLYVLVMLIVALMVPAWRQLDWRFFLLLSGHVRPSFSSRIVVIDVRYHNELPDEDERYARLRADIGSVLSRIAAERKAGRAPIGVLVDADFSSHATAERAYKAEFGQLLKGLRSLQSASPPTPAIPVFVAARPDELQKRVTLDPRVYGTFTPVGHTGGAIADYGHTVIENVIDVDDALFYATCEFAGGYELKFLPLVALHDVSDCDPEPHIIPVGVRSALSKATVRYSPQQSGWLKKGALAEKWVIVGSPGQDPGNGSRSGPELVAWAFSDLLQEAGLHREARSYGPLIDHRIELAIVAVFSIATVVVYNALFGVLRRIGRLRWIAALVGAVLAGVSGVAASVWLLFEAHNLYPQVSLALAGVFVAGGLSAARGRQLLWEAAVKEDIRQALEAREVLYDVFISYAQGIENTPWVKENVLRPLEQTVLPNGRRLRIYFDSNVIRVGTAWLQKMMRGLAGSRYVIPVYTTDYFSDSRPYCNLEMLRALQKWATRRDSVLPLMRGDVSVPDEFNHIQFLSIEKRPHAVDEIIAAIVRGLEEDEGKTS